MKKSLTIVLAVLACAFGAPASALAAGSGSIAGTITDASSGLPIEGAEACAYGDGAPSCAVSDASGAYKVTELAPGNYKAWFSDSGDGYLEQYFDDTTEWWNAELVSVTSGNTTAGIDAALEKSGSVGGTVTDAGTGEPVAGINVCAERTSGNSYNCETSGPDGTYTISGLRPGSYKVSFRSGWIETGPGEYEPVSYVRQYYDGKATEGAADPVSVAAGATSTGIDAAMVPGAEVEGTVGDGTAPVEDVEVCAYQATSQKEAGCGNTDEEGNYLIAGIPNGSYKLRFLPSTESVYAPQYYDGKSTFAAADAVALAAGAKTTGIDATLIEAGKISGTVTKAGGGAVQGLQVCAYPSEGPSVKCASTSPTGGYTINGVVAGEYIVYFSGGTEYLTQYYAGASSSYDATRLTVENGVTESGIDAVMAPAGRIKGHVTGADTGKSISNIQVCAVKTTASSYFPDGVCTNTDGEGNYTIGGLRTGNYDVRFVPGYGEISPGNYGQLNYLDQYYKGAGTRSASQPVSVTAGSATAGIDAALQPGGQITGTVTDAITHDGAVAYVCALPTVTRGGTERCATSAADGTYTIPRLPTGSYKVRFSAYASSIGYIHQFYKGKATKKEADPVAVVAGATVTGIDAAMHKGGVIAGTVTDAATHTSLVGIEVCSGGYGSCDTTASDGSYELVGLPSGSYRVHFFGREAMATYADVYYHDKPTWEEAQKVTVTVGSVTGGIDQEMHEGGRISGTVIDDTTEEPLEGISVCASDPDAYGYRCSHTGELGQYEIAGLQPGSYLVHFARQSAWDPSTAKYAPQYFEDAVLPADATRVDVGLGGSASGIDAAMHEGGAIDGLVTAASDHAPLAGVGVCAIPEEEVEEEIEFCVSTDSSGEYTLRGFATGSYAVAFFPGWQAPFEVPNLLRQYYDGSSTRAGAQQVTVTAGSTTHGIDAELQAGGTISGVVTAAADGSRLEGIEACAWKASEEEFPASCASSNAHGEYTITHLPPGTYKVRFTAFVYDGEHEYLEEEEGEGEPQREEEFSTQYWKTASSLGAAQGITLAPGQSVNGIDAQMVKPTVPPSEPPQSGGDGGSSSGGGGQQNPSSSPPQVSPPPAPGPQPPKAVHCRRGFKKKRVHGKVRCVKPHKHNGKKHRHSR